MTELEEPLQLPQVSAGIKAIEYPHRKNENFVWHIWIYISGYDGRYAPGYATLEEENIDKLIDALRNALEKMEMLTKQSSSGTFKKDLLRIQRLSIGVAASSGHITTTVTITSSTGYILSRSLSSANVNAWIVRLQEAKEKGPQMLQTLQLLV